LLSSSHSQISFRPILPEPYPGPPCASSDQVAILGA
jgi:hypothetical protein